MKVNEIFYSIQGEGVHQGVPMVFVRMQGCNLLPHCSYCDTTYAQDIGRGKELSISDVVDEVNKQCNFRTPSWVCITGGEPLWQETSLLYLVKQLKERGYSITIETNGSFQVPSWFGIVDSWSADIKCPSSGVIGTSKDDWFGIRDCDQIKFVVGPQEDLDFVRYTLDRHRGAPPQVLVSPVIFVDDTGHVDLWRPQESIKLCLELGVRFSLQIHKIIWGNKKGV